MQQSIKIMNIYRKKQKLEVLRFFYNIILNRNNYIYLFILIKKLLEFLTKFQKKFGKIYKKLNDLDEEKNLINAYEIIPVINKAKKEYEEDKAIITKFKCLENMGNFLSVIIY